MFSLDKVIPCFELINEGGEGVGSISGNSGYVGKGGRKLVSGTRWRENGGWRSLLS